MRFFFFIFLCWCCFYSLSLIGDVKFSNNIVELLLEGYFIYAPHFLYKRFFNSLYRGQFILNNATNLGLVAYVSSKACSKVHSTATALPRLLDVEMLLRCDVWPESFDMLPPNGDSIGLYFVPQYERYAYSMD